MVDLDEYCREGNRAKIHEAESTKNTGRASIVKSLSVIKTLPVQICDYDEIIALAAELRNKNILVSFRWSLNTSLISQ